MVRFASERFSSYSHLLGAFLSVIGTIVLLFFSWPSAIQISLAIIYGVSNIFLFSASATYHPLKIKENDNTLSRCIDHVAIFVLIAGSYTPICYFYLTGWMQIGIIAIQWGIVLVGLFLKIFVINTPRWITSGIYLIMGWIILIPLRN